MSVRVVRFTDVNTEQFEAMLSRIQESDGPPPEVPATRIKILYDEQQQTAVVLQNYANAEDLKTGEAFFDAMDSGDTPGTRASVDRCEVKLEREAP